MKTVAVLTTFFEVESGFSLIRVAETQIKMMLAHGITPAVMMHEHFKPAADGVWRRGVVDLRCTMPQMTEDFDTDVENVLEAMRDGLADVDIAITHDLILMPYYLPHNVAMRRYAEERPGLTWLHFVHSYPQEGRGEWPQSAMYEPPPGYIVYPNSSDLGGVARRWNMQGREGDILASRASHSIDPLEGFDPLTVSLAEKAHLLSGDVVAIYPCAMHSGKQVDRAIRLMAGMQRWCQPRLLVVDWQATGAEFQKREDGLLELARGLGMANSFNFTSRLDDRAESGVPRRVVQELFRLSNVYIHPSSIETYSFVVHEAMLNGLLCVLNNDLPMMRELFGDNALYVDFGSLYIGRGEPSQDFYVAEAQRIHGFLRRNRALTAKMNAQKRWSPEAMWRDFSGLLAVSDDS